MRGDDRSRRHAVGARIQLPRGDPKPSPSWRGCTDLVELCDAAIDARLHECDALWDPRAALGVVLAAGGYPDRYRKGDVIEGLEAAEATGCKVFHAGTALSDGRVVTAGGRVLCVTALGDTVSAAQSRAYAAVDLIHWQGMHYRRDIGDRAIAREP
jgi:phosphoribosylamine--glycine ligase